MTNRTQANGYEYAILDDETLALRTLLQISWSGHVIAMCQCRSIDLAEALRDAHIAANEVKAA